MNRLSAYLLAGAVALMAPAAFAETTVEFWHSFADDRENGKALAEIIDNFEAANPDITIDAQFIGNYNDIVAKLQAAIPARRAPDAVIMEVTRYGLFADRGVLEDLTEQLWRSPNLPRLIQREILDDGEYLERLAEQWLRPIVEEGRGAMEKSSWAASWESDTDSLIILLMYHVIFGYFFSAPLTRRVLGVEPASDEMRHRQVEFLKLVAQRLMVSS